VIAVDGPSASGKGTVASRVASVLGFHYLESGALYRLVAMMGGPEPAADARNLPAEFRGQRILLLGQDVTEFLYTEEVGAGASLVAAIPAVRAALMERQRAYRRPPGLAADGRDMGTVVFPDAVLKIFLTATVQARAERRHKQLKDKGINANLAALSRELAERDERDAARSVAPLRPAADAVIVDSTSLGIDEVVGRVLALYRERTGGSAPD
jgi:cytidylate kinase